jgi:signal transduction histidine kinase
MQVEQARDLLLGMLGHDMRNPLQIIQGTAAYLSALNADATVSEAASRLIRSGARMQALLDDLVDFNRTRLGLGINIAPTDVDLAEICADELAQIRSVHPDRELDLEVRGDCKGFWDGHRLRQLVSNLVLNAIKYGASDTPVQVVVSGDETEARLDVSNCGAAIQPAVLEQLFAPLKRGPEHANTSTPDGSLGLGLYIAREIAIAHGGQIEARSDDTETVFAVRLPRSR